MEDMITIPKEKFEKVLDDVENLLIDIEALAETEVDDISRKRLDDIEKGVVVDGGSEEELNEYLRKRGVEIE
jgi:hypothetical protein